MHCHPMLVSCLRVTNPGLMPSSVKLSNAVCVTHSSTLTTWHLLLTNACLVTYYPAKPTAYIIFFHRNAASALLPLLEPVAITLPSRILTLIPIKISSLIVVCFNFYNKLPHHSNAFSLVAFTTVTFLYHYCLSIYVYNEHYIFIEIL